MQLVSTMEFYMEKLEYYQKLVHRLDQAFTEALEILGENQTDQEIIEELEASWMRAWGRAYP